MHPTSRPRLFVASLLLAATASVTHAQNVFVCLGGKANLPALVSLAPPGHGWDYSAAAPVPGAGWNRVKRTTGAEATAPGTPGVVTPGERGTYPLDTAIDLPLCDPLGQPTSVLLNIEVEINTLADDKPRAEPAIHSKSKGAVPELLMQSAWRVFAPGNRLCFTLSGLVPKRRYSLYLYGSSVDPVTNPTGEHEGARFSLAPANLVAGSPGEAQTTGGYCGSVYTYAPEHDRIAPSPAGTTWVLLNAAADAKGRLSFYSAENSHKRHFVNGFQLVETTP